MESTQFNYALLRADFEPVRDMEKYIHAIKSSLKNFGYTSVDSRLDADRLIADTLINSDSSFGDQNVSTLLKLIDFSQKRSPGFILEPSSITFHTNCYDSHDSIVLPLILGLESVHQEISLDQITRLGFRYFKPVDFEKEDLWKVPLGHFDEECSGAKAQYALVKHVFATDFEPTKEKGSLTMNIHYTETLEDQSIVSGGEYSPLFNESITGFSETEDQVDQLFFVIFDSEHFIDTSFTLDSDQIRTVSNSLILKSASLFGTIKEINTHKNNDLHTLLPKVLALQPDIFSDKNTMSVQEHIENIRKVLKIRIDVLTDLFNVSDKTVYKWMSGASLPELEQKNLIVQLSEFANQFEKSNVSRPDLLIEMKMFNSKSLMDLVRSGKATDKHVEALIEEDRIMEQAYRESGLANSKSTPSDDWKSSISIPGTIGNY